MTAKEAMKFAKENKVEMVDYHAGEAAGIKRLAGARRRTAPKEAH